MDSITKGFILTANQLDQKNSSELHFFGTGECGSFEIIITKNKHTFFILSNTILPQFTFHYNRKKVKLKNFDKNDVDALYFNTLKDFYSAKESLKKEGIKIYESDIRPYERYLMERFIYGCLEIHGKPEKEATITRFYNPLLKPASDYKPKFKILSLDIETGSKGELFSIAFHYYDSEREVKKVLIVGEKQEDMDKELSIESYPSEKEILIKFLIYLKRLDPDIIIGWHVIGFDLLFLEDKYNKYNIPFSAGRDGKAVKIIKRRNAFFADIHGRIVIDGPVTLRASFYTFDNFKLETVAQELLGHGKEIELSGEDKIAEIERRYKEDKVALAKYNLMDCLLVSQIFEKTGLIDLSFTRTCISGMLMDRIGASTAAFDYFMLPKIHRKGFVAPDVGDIPSGASAAGGYVMRPVTGIHEHIIVLDFKSLYPSIIRTFKIDPLSLLQNHLNPLNTPAQIKFSRTEHVLADYITELMDKREAAKKRGDLHLSQSIKILMNSFYGVMGSSGCRFYHYKLPTAITGTGQWLMKLSADYFKQRGFLVLYGDTDSVFVQLKKDPGKDVDRIGGQLAEELNNFIRKKLKAEFNVESALDIEFEKYFLKFLLPSVRSGNGGAKKRYAGLMLAKGETTLHFTGMEFVRSDWTLLAKKFQYELYRRVFYNEKVEEWMRDFVEKLRNHSFDKELIYRKRMTKAADAYHKTVPPHVKAARLLPAHIQQNIRRIEYVITLRGPIPLQLAHDDIDYNHYVEKQLKPLADSILNFLGQSFEGIVEGEQLTLF